MKAIKTMREVMFAASLLAAAACGSVKSVDDSDDEQMMNEDTDQGGDGSGSGSAGGDSDDMPTACTTAADCGNGMACDVATHECVTGMLTLDASEFVNDGLRWWTNTSEPTLRGTFVGPTAAVVQVIVGAGTGKVATLTGNMWSVKLAPGSIGAADTLVKIMMTDPSGGLVVREQLIAFDTIAPVIGVTGSKVRDERGDVIDFSSGEPVHDHQGAEVELGVGCPTVYKHAYLMGATAPAFGSEVSRNPLAWRFAITDAQVIDAEYRVLATDGLVVADWTPLANIGNVWSVELTRDGVHGFAELGESMRFRIEVVATDWAGNQASKEYCWDHQPLAAPLEIEQAHVASGPEALAVWSLPLNSPVSKMLGIGSGASLVEQRIVQHTTEPIHLTLSTSAVQATYQAGKLAGFVPSTSLGKMPCGTRCSAPTPTAVPEITSGVITRNAPAVLVDDATGDIMLPIGNAIVIPARDTLEPPRSYTVRVNLGHVTELRPGAGAAYDEHTFAGSTFTGNIPLVPSVTACVTPPVQTCSELRCSTTCTMMNFEYIEALDSATLDVSPVTINMQTAAARAISRPVHHVPAATFTAPAFTWDGGNDDLPGPY